MTAAARMTGLLAVILLLLVGLDVGVRLLDTPDDVELPSTAPVSLAEVQRIRVTRGGERIDLERVGDSGNWKLTAPVEGPADSASVRDLLSRLRRGVQMQVKMDVGNHEKYGLESGNALRLEVYVDDDDVPEVDLYVGADTVGGASFVRFPDDEVVYRAQIGGRHRLDRPPRDWRDPSVFSFEPDAASALSLTPAEGMPISLRRTPQGWAVADLDGFPVDQQTVRDVLERLGGLRAGRVLPSDFPLDGAPILTATIERDGLDPVTMRFYGEGELGYVTRDGRDEVFQIAGSVPRRLTLPLAAWRDRQLIDIDFSQIHRMTLNNPQQGRFVLEQDAADSSWRVIEPKNVDANLRESMQAARTLSQLRAEGIADLPPERAGFPSQVWIELELQGGEKRRLELGPPTMAPDGKTRLVFARTLDQPDRIAVLEASVLLRVSAAFSQ